MEDDSSPPPTSQHMAVSNWLKSLQDHANKVNDIELKSLLQDIPEELKGVDVENLIMPVPDAMHEDAYRPTRPLLIALMDNAERGTNAIQIRNGIERWGYGYLIPHWFMQYEGQVTKEAIASLFYELIVKHHRTGYKDPSKPTRPAGPPRKEVRLIIVKQGEAGTNQSMVRTYPIRGQSTITDERNRHELPKEFRKFFRTEAMRFHVSLEYTDGVPSIGHHVLILGAKQEYEHDLVYSLNIQDVPS